MKEISVGMAELAGIFSADGSMWESALCFWGNITEDRDYYDITLKNLFKINFGIDVNPHEKKSNSVYGFYVCKKEIINCFNSVLGAPFGSKTYTLRVPRIVMDSNKPEVWAAFLRGFCDGDGCLTFGKRYGAKYKKYRRIFHMYPRIFLISVSNKAILDMSELLKRLDIQHFISKTTKVKENESPIYRICIYGVKRLEKWMKDIGFNNPVHQTKYEIFKRYNFVPVHTSLKQRREILAGKINPLVFYSNGPVAQFG